MQLPFKAGNLLPFSFNTSNKTKFKICAGSLPEKAQFPHYRLIQYYLIESLN